MALKKEKKAELIKEMSDAVSNSPSMVFVHSKGLPVNDSNELRSKLREENSKYKVVKKTLLKRVLDEAKLDGEQPPLDGEIAIAYGDDVIAPARDVFEFQKKHKDNIKIVGGIFEGVLKSESEMMEIATIPGIQQLRGMFVNVINSPIQGLAVALGQIAEKKAE